VLSFPGAEKCARYAAGRIVAGDLLATRDNCVIEYVRPVYPKEARKARIQSLVRLRVFITKTGDIGEIHVVSGDPVFVPAAITAVKRWRYAPCRLNNEPIERWALTDVPFTLNQ
jgi:protein TonB